MEEKNTQGKTLVVNCATCNATQVREETLQAYDHVVINAATILVSEESVLLLHRYNTSLNAASVITVPAGSRLVAHNGHYTIAKSETPAPPTALILNGSLTIEPGASLDSYALIQVNGSILCPESLSVQLGRMHVNGSIDCYPDDAVVLKRTFVVDRVFALRARAASYFAARRVVLTDCALDVAGLAQKGARFLTRQAIVAEPLLEAAIPLFGDEAEIIAVPEGCAFVNDDLTLDDKALRKHGSKLYVNGDLTLNAASEEVLRRLEFLRVNGDVRLPAGLVDAFEAIPAEYGELKVVRDVCICDRPFAKVGLAALEEPGGISVWDCAKVALSPDIPAQLIRERLDIRDCAVVKCTPEQRDAVEAVSTDVAAIQDGREEENETNGFSFGGASLGDMLKDAITGKKKVINAAEYQL